MFLPESEMVDRARSSTPYERRADPDYNPLRFLQAAASLVGRGEPAHPEQIKLLKHHDPAVRYWGGVGLFCARYHIADHVEELRPHLRDSAPYVRCEVAAAVYCAARDGEAFDVLVRLLDHDAPMIAYQAVQKILYMPDMANDFAEAVSALRQKVRDEDCAYTGNRFPVEQAVDMYMYVYRGEDLYYPGDLKYCSKS
jgi:hypothetical protein